MAKVGFYVSTHHPLSMNMAYALKTHPLDTVHAKIITGIHYEERAQCKVHDKKCFQSHPRSRARALRASTVLVTRPPRQMTIMMSMNIWDTHHHGHDALSTQARRGLLITCPDRALTRRGASDGWRGNRGELTERRGSR